MLPEWRMIVFPSGFCLYGYTPAQTSTWNQDEVESLSEERSEEVGWFQDAQERCLV